ncbi:MAG: hypothetical protein PHS57_05890 [Alphaproteobacteria bacterium]|nr:hypothetical protein [Alphaproteobacteria bacterium]
MVKKIGALIKEAFEYSAKKLDEAARRAEVRNMLATVSSRRFSDACFYEVRAENNTYGVDGEILRMKAAYELIEAGMDEYDVLQALENHNEGIALSVQRFMNG